MKILILISSMDRGGAETHVFELCRALKKLNQEVVLASSGGFYADLLKKEGTRQLRLPFDSKSPFAFLYSYAKLLRFMKKEKFDIVHAHSRICAYIGQKISQKLKICFVTTVHAKFKSDPIKKYMSRWGYYASAISADLAQYLVDIYGIGSNRICVIPNGIDTEKFRPKTGNLQNKSGAKSILFASRLDGDCSAAAYALLKIAPLLAKKYEGIEIYICGGGDEYGKVMRICERLNKSLGYRCANALGYVENLSEILPLQDIVIGVSRVILEGMSCGVNVILAGNEGYIGEISELNADFASKSNFCGRGESLTSESRLFDDICKILDRGDKNISTGEFLRSYIKDNYSIEKTAKKTLEFYKFAFSHVFTDGGDICFLGYYGFGNMGDDTLLAMAKSWAAENIGGKSVALSKSSRDRYIFGLPCYGRKNIFGILRAIKGSEYLILGGGTLFQDRSSLRSVLYYTTISKIALKMGKKVILLSNGVNVSGKFATKQVKSILKRAERIGLRDKMSKDFVLSLGIDESRIISEQDLAFNIYKWGNFGDFFCNNIWDREKFKGILTLGKFFAVSVCKKCKDVHLEMMKSEVDRGIKSGLSCIIIGMYGKEDRKKSLELCKDFGAIYIEFSCAEELISFLSRSEFIISMRLHLLIFAKVLGIDFMGIGDDTKLISFCQENGGKIAQ